MWVCFGSRSENWRVLLISAADCAKRAGASQILFFLAASTLTNIPRGSTAKKVLYTLVFTRIQSSLQHGTIQPTARSLGSRHQSPSGANSDVQKWSNLAFVYMRCKYFEFIPFTMSTAADNYPRPLTCFLLVQRLARQLRLFPPITTIGFARKRECGVGFG